MKHVKELFTILEGLQTRYGSSAFRAVLKRMNRRRLTQHQREERKKFPWSKYRKFYGIQKGVCPLCNEVMPFLKGKIEIDHRDPNRKDFNNDNNLQLTHKECNRKKSSKSLYEASKETGKTIREILD